MFVLYSLGHLNMGEQSIFFNASHFSYFYSIVLSKNNRYYVIIINESNHKTKPNNKNQTHNTLKSTHTSPIPSYNNK